MKAAELKPGNVFTADRDRPRRERIVESVRTDRLGVWIRVPGSTGELWFAPSDSVNLIRGKERSDVV